MVVMVLSRGGQHLVLHGHHEGGSEFFMVAGVFRSKEHVTVQHIIVQFRILHWGPTLISHVVWEITWLVCGLFIRHQYVSSHVFFSFQFVFVARGFQ